MEKIGAPKHSRLFLKDLAGFGGLAVRVYHITINAPADQEA
jgi:hypothetical protein